MDPAAVGSAAIPQPKQNEHDDTDYGTTRCDAGLLCRRAHPGARIPEKIPAPAAGSRKGPRGGNGGGPVRRPAQIPRRGLHQRNGHRAGRNPRPVAAPGTPGPQPEGAHAALSLSLGEPHHPRAERGGARHGAVELPLPARPRSAGGRDRRRQLRGAETLRHLGTRRSTCGYSRATTPPRTACWIAVSTTSSSRAVRPSDAR